MTRVLKYDKEHEETLLALLRVEPDWHSFTAEGRVEAFKKALLVSDTYVCESQGEICGYIRALVDGFGVYVSELYVAPSYRNHGHGKRLLEKVKQAHPRQDVYALSDEDRYYRKLGYRRIGSVFQL